MEKQLTPEEIKDIQEREKLALEHLKANSLTPAALVQKVNIGNDTFVDKVICFLQDTKYIKKEGVPSPFDPNVPLDISPNISPDVPTP